MTAENSRRASPRPRRRPGFNEAAADDRGKLPLVTFGGAKSAASMRPRPMTAENERQRLVRGPIERPASMRPRPMTAENISVQWHARELARALQ